MIFQQAFFGMPFLLVVCKIFWIFHDQKLTVWNKINQINYQTWDLS